MRSVRWPRVCLIWGSERKIGYLQREREGDGEEATKLGRTGWGPGLQGPQSSLCIPVSVRLEGRKHRISRFPLPALEGSLWLSWRTIEGAMSISRQEGMRVEPKCLQWKDSRYILGTDHCTDEKLHGQKGGDKIATCFCTDGCDVWDWEEQASGDDQFSWVKFVMPKRR